MKRIFILSLTLIFCLINSSCLKDDSAIARNAGAIPTPSAAVAAAPAQPVTISRSPTPENKNQPAPPNAEKINLAELQKDISNNLGNLSVVDSYKPPAIEADLNGDGIGDLAVVVAAARDQDGDENKIGEMFPELGKLAEGITFQNLRLGGILFAGAGVSGIEIDKNKSKLKPNSKLALLVVLSGTKDWRYEIGQTDYDKKFLLLDSVFDADYEDERNSPEMLGLIKKGNECLPKEAKGEGILSGDAESAAKAIYFNGKNFIWTQCGD